MQRLIYTIATSIDPGQLPHAQASPGQVQTILTLVFQVIGSLALLMIVVSGFRYVIAGGDQQKTKQAKEGIAYALVGLVVAITAVAIVTYVGKNI